MIDIELIAKGALLSVWLALVWLTFMPAHFLWLRDRVNVKSQEPPEVDKKDNVDLHV